MELVCSQCGQPCTADEHSTAGEIVCVQCGQSRSSPEGIPAVLPVLDLQLDPPRSPPEPLPETPKQSAQPRLDTDEEEEGPWGAGGTAGFLPTLQYLGTTTHSPFQKKRWGWPLAVVGVVALLAGSGVAIWLLGYRSDVPEVDMIHGDSAQFAVDDQEGEHLVREADILEGEPTRLGGRLYCTFWYPDPFTGDESWLYYHLSSAEKKELIADPVIEAPDGFVVQAESLEVQTLATHRGTFFWDQYVVRGIWMVTVPPGTPRGTYTIRVTLPGVAAIREQVEATGPATSTMVLRVHTFASPQARSLGRAERRAPSILLCLGLVLLQIALACACWHEWRFLTLALPIGALAVAVALPHDLVPALDELWTISWAVGLGALAALNLLIVGFIWLVAGRGHWSEVSTLVLAGLIVALIPFAGLAWLLPIGELEALRDQLRNVLPAFLPGLVVAWLLARWARTRRPPAPALRRLHPDELAITPPAGEA